MRKRRCNGIDTRDGTLLGRPEGHKWQLAPRHNDGHSHGLQRKRIHRGVSNRGNVSGAM